MDVKWQFCPKCGSRLVWLDWLGSSSDVSVGQQSLNLRVLTRASQEVTVSLKVSPDDSAVRLKKDVETIRVEGEKIIAVPLSVGEGDYAEVEASVEEVIRSAEGHLFEVRDGRNKVDRGTLSNTKHLYIQGANDDGLWASKEVIFASRREVSAYLHFEGLKRQTLLYERPQGWRILTRQPDFGKDDPCELVVNESHDAKECDLVVRAMPANKEICIRLIPKPKRSFALTASCLLAIDFGSSRTSIRYIDLQNSNAEPVPLGQEHIPTAIHMVHANDPSTWTYGQAALDNAQIKGHFLRDFKRFLWNADKTELAPGVTAFDALFYYCKYLLEHCIQPEVRELCGVRLADLNYNIALSMPVLTGEESALYKAALESAFTKAGFNPLGGFRFMLEPDAALACLYPYIQESENPLNEGDGVLVVDSGGGTTDISIGKVMSEGGDTTLSIISQAQVQLTELRKDGKVVGPDFGGEDVTRAHGTVAIDNWLSKYVKAERRKSIDADTVELRKKGIKRLFRDSGRTPFWTERDKDLAVFDPNVSKSLYWDRVDGDLYERFEGSKKLIDPSISENGAGERKTSLKHTIKTFEASLEMPSLEISNSDREYIHARFGEELRKEISRILQTAAVDFELSGGSIKRICFVGGNCLIDSFTTVEPNWGLTPFVPAKRLMQSAVVNGLAATSRLAKCFSHSYRVVLSGEVLMTLLRGSVPVAQSRQIDFNPGEDPSEVKVEVEHDGEWLCAERMLLPVSESSIRLTIRFSGSSLRIDAFSSGFAMRRTEVEVVR